MSNVTGQDTTADPRPKSHEELLIEIDRLIRPKPGKLHTLPEDVAEYIERSQILLSAIAKDRDEWKARATALAWDPEGL